MLPLWCLCRLLLWVLMIVAIFGIVCLFTFMHAKQKFQRAHQSEQHIHLATTFSMFAHLLQRLCTRSQLALTNDVDVTVSLELSHFDTSKNDAVAWLKSEKHAPEVWTLIPRGEMPT